MAEGSGTCRHGDNVWLATTVLPVYPLTAKQMAQNAKRRAFIETSAAVGLGLGVTYTGLDALAAEQRKGIPGKLPYKTVYNQDDSVLFRSDEPIEPEDVDRMVDQVIDGGADLFLACCNNHKTNYQSQA